MGHSGLPKPDQLREYGHAVAGHAGTLCDDDGLLFVKPCTQSEIDFYESASRRHPEFAALMPLYMGSLTLKETNDAIDEAVAGVISDAGDVQMVKEHLAAAVAEQVSRPLPQGQSDAGQVSGPLPQGQSDTDNIAWISTKGRKIQTDTAVVLQNATSGFQKANIIDVKLGVRLYADDAPEEKKDRFKKLSAETTHDKFGLRIAGMRVYRGSSDASQLNENGYKIYDKDYGRTSVTKDNIVDAFRKFMFPEAAGIDDDLGKAVCAAFARDLARVRDVMTRHESRMYSTSLLFVFEGDGDTLRAAIEKNNKAVESAAARESHDRGAMRFDSGIVLDDDDDDDGDDDDLEASLPRIYSLKLIDFAHAQWTPGLGPDENILKGVRSLEDIFKQLVE